MREPTKRISVLACPVVVAAMLLGAATLVDAQAAPGRASAPDTARRGARTVNGIELHYREWGAGEPLVLLHGFGGCAAEWAPLAEHLAGHRMIAVDLRAHGASTGDAAGFTHRQAAIDVLALLDSLRIERFRAIGFSSGGMVLLNMAAVAPERVQAMIAVSTAHRLTDETRAALAAIQRSAGDDRGPSLRAYLQRCATRGDAQADALLRRWGALADEPGR